MKYGIKYGINTLIWNLSFKCAFQNCPNNSRKDQAAIVFGSHTRCFKSFAGYHLFQYHLHVGALNASQIQPWSSSTTDAESQSTGGTQLFIPGAPSRHHQGVRHFWR